MKAWKGKETQLTAWLSDLGLWQAERHSRALRGEAVEDIEWGPFSIELKTRASLPKYLLGWMAQAVTNAVGKIPVVVLHQDGTRMGQQLIVMRLSDWVQMIRKEFDNARLS